MKLKTYHSESVEAAVRLAGVELGDDAVFLGSRENPRGQGGDGYEVTFAVMETAAVSAETEPQAGGDARSSAAPIPARQTPAQRTVRTTPARLATAAAGASRTMSFSSPPTERGIEPPH